MILIWCSFLSLFLTLSLSLTFSVLSGDIKVNNDNLYFRLFKFIIGYDRLALGEAYMDGDWDADLLPFFEKALKSKYTFHNGILLLSKIRHSLPLLTFNLQTKSRCKKDISTHYDIGNDMFKLMLDRSMNYSCGYWTSNVDLQTGTYTLCETVDEAQMNKMKLIARKLDLKPNMRVLDIGCGWGYLAKFLAINFGRFLAHSGAKCGIVCCRT